MRSRSNYYLSEAESVTGQLIALSQGHNDEVNLFCESSGWNDELQFTISTTLINLCIEVICCFNTKNVYK